VIGGWGSLGGRLGKAGCVLFIYLRTRMPPVAESILYFAYFTLIGWAVP
jgi:hypothetical protein